MGSGSGGPLGRWIGHWIGHWTFRNPLLRKELRQRMRSGRTVLGLSLYLVIIGAVAFIFMYLNVQGQTLLLQPTRTAELFTFLSYLQLALISFVTPGVAAGVISGERERQTLPVLLTTPLAPASVIFTKWVTSISFLSLLIIMTLPLYSIVFLFGGVAPSQVLAVFLLQFMTLGAIAGVSIFWSTYVQRTGWSTVLSYATVALLFIGAAVAGYLLDGVAARNPDEGAWAWVGGICYAINPIYMQAALEASRGFFTPAFHNSLVESIFQTVQTHNLTGPGSWTLFVSLYIGGSVVMLILCTWRLRPGSIATARRQILRWIAR